MIISFKHDSHCTKLKVGASTTENYYIWASKYAGHFNDCMLFYPFENMCFLEEFPARSQSAVLSEREIL